MASKYPLTRSIVNESIARAKKCFQRFGVALPPFALWTAADWAGKGPEADELRDCMLGWDVTDFGSERFYEIGRVLFTLRNGTTRQAGYAKSYAEKLLFDPELQRAPAHYHRSKNEDICCRAGGNILVQLTGLNPDDTVSDRPLTIKVDGWATAVAAKGIVRLRPGMSVNIPPRTIHQFWGEEGTGETVSSEVSSVCDDLADNVFLQAAVRFPPLVEDAPKQHLLCHEYPAAARD
ncbi:MAG: D-lyxose/D-mannose family sugar isomerase [Lacunisphaera sp.]